MKAASSSILVTMAQILAGPALRRTDESQINIWLALNKSASVTATAYSNPQGSAIGSGSSAEYRPVQMGKNLFFYLIKVAPPEDGTFPMDEKIYYDVEIDGQSLKVHGLLTGDKKIVYEGEPLPSLVIPTKHRHILQGSCRRPHAEQKGGTGQRDQLTYADTLLSTSINSLHERPTMLLLTGDQIYADDVATPLLAALNKKGAELVGKNEELPARKGKKRKTKPHTRKLHDRDRLYLTAEEGFTPGKNYNHLMTYGEFVAMYLVVWGGVDVDLPEWRKVKNQIGKHSVQRSAAKGRMTKLDDNTTEKNYEQEKARLNGFLSTCWQVRRAMANVPTYMMFDDHEVTDDWNLSKDVQKSLSASGSLGRRLTTNALAAYWVCQGWGNDPEAFDAGFKNTLSDYFSALDEGKAEAAEKALHGVYWSYAVPGYPALIALDTRTNRSFNKEGAPKLMSDEGFDWLEKQIGEFGQRYAGQRDQQTLLMISPAPVLGFKPLEFGQEILRKLRESLSAIVDAEYWSADPDTYDRFKSILIKNSFTERVIWASGDVHYSYCAEEVNDGGLRFIQVTSSAACNELPGFMESVSNFIEGIWEGRIPVLSYLFATGQDKVTNPHNSIGSLYFQEGKPTRAIEHFFNPESGQEYDWEYDLVDPRPGPVDFTGLKDQPGRI